MDKIELSIKPSLFSGYNGPKFYKKPEISTYDKLPVALVMEPVRATSTI